MARQVGDLAARFADSYTPVPESGCWLWDKSVNDYGYGRINVGGRILRAHRVSYEQHVGEIPAEMLVCHKCDTPSCVNPSHLFLGDHAANTQDMLAKGRHKYVEGVGGSRTKLTPTEVLSIRNRLAQGDTHRAIAADFRVGKGTVQHIREGGWRSVSDGS